MQVSQKRGTDFVWQGELLLTPPFAAHRQLPACPVNVSEFELRNLART
jgi:hypothetical protein